jgi:hypothetical protein
MCLGWQKAGRRQLGVKGGPGRPGPGVGPWWSLAAAAGGGAAVQVPRAATPISLHAPRGPPWKGRMESSGEVSEDLCQDGVEDAGVRRSAA